MLLTEYLSWLVVVHGTCTLPTYPGEITVKALGMDVDVFSPGGKSLPAGESGELVCKKPFPNMPLFFWNDKGNKRYLGSYFETFSSKLSSSFKPRTLVNLMASVTNTQTSGLTGISSNSVLNLEAVMY
jgi:acetoacetyl-CoA synthetase